MRGGRVPDRASRARFKAAAASTAAVVALVLAASPSWSGSAVRNTTSHVFIGLTPNAGFAVSVNGQPLETGTVLTSDLGIATFDVNEDALPDGPRFVVIGDPGDLTISEVTVDGVTSTSATVRWTTNLPSTSSVTYGPTSEYGSAIGPDSTLVVAHAVDLTGLAAGTTYHYVVSSDDGQGHAASSGDGSFTTEQAPLVIENVAVDSVGQTWAAVSWTTNRPADSWLEYGPTTDYGSSTSTDTTLVEAHRVLVDGLTPGSVYHVRARSDDGEGGSTASDDVQLTTDPSNLAFTDVGASEVGDTWAVISWTTDRASSSRVEYGASDEYGTSTPTNPDMVTAHEVAISGLKPGTVYHLRAWSDDGVTPPASSGDHTFSTLVAELELSNVTVGPVGQTWAMISWLTNRPASTFVAYGETDGYGLVESPGGGFVTEHSATLSGLAEGTLYHFSVVSFDADLQEAASPDSTFVTMEGEETGPPQIEGVDCETVSATSVMVSWTTDRPATSQVLYGTGGAYDCRTVVDTVLATDHSILVWPIVPRVEYSFVAASACGCDTSYCSPLSYTTSPPPAESSIVRPIDFIKIIVTPDDGSSAVVTWASDRPCSTWVDYGDSDAYGKSAPGFPLGQAAYRASLDGLTSGGSYHIRVSGWDAPGGEAVGEDVVFEMVPPPDHQAPSRPTGVVCSLCEAGVEVRWDSNVETDLAGYNIYRARGREAWVDWSRAEMLNSLPLTEERYLDSSVESEASYSYAVTAVDRSGNESTSSESVGIETDTVGPGVLRLAAYPNPVRYDALFAFALPPGVSTARLRVLSPSGRVVMDATADARRSADEQTLTWDTRDPSGWPVGEGVYLCELRAGESVVRTKLTILR